MKKNPKHFCIILAGGRGRRLWPYSRDKQPKQFIDFFGTGRTQIQSTFDRFARILPPENIYICTNREYAPLVREQLPELSEENLMIEPVNRNTAASVAWATIDIQRRVEDACIVITPSDQIVLNDEVFGNDVIKGLGIVDAHNIVLTMGVKPTRPEPGYGYIQMGEYQPEANVFYVQSFTEKPEREFAKMFVESNEFLWNTGLLIAGAPHLRQCLKKMFFEIFSPELCDGHTYTHEQVLHFIEHNYASLPNIAIDSGLLEQAEKVFVMRCDFGWADLGTWHSVYECMSHNEGDNVIVNSQVIIEDSRNNVIKLPEDHLAVINGLDGYIVAEKDNVLLICKRSDSSALIRKYVNEVQIKYGDEFI
jgi:mannose-1-phosphate guanylyltransferase